MYDTAKQELRSALDSLQTHVKPLLVNAWKELGEPPALDFFREYYELENGIFGKIYELSQKKNRERFFSALKMEDDGRREPLLTDEEYREFSRDKEELKTFGGKPCVPIWYRQEAYGDRTAYYCQDLNAVRENFTSIGD